MQKLKKALPFVALVSFLVLKHFQQAQVADSIILIALCGLCVFRMHLDSKEQPDIRKEVYADMEKLVNEINKIKDDMGQVSLVQQRKTASERIRF